MTFDDMRFENILRDIVVNENAFRHELENSSPSTRDYVVFFVARSGSSWLTTLLSGTDLLGNPEEYINPEFVRDVAVSLNSREQGPFLNMLKRRRKSKNGVFGIEVREVDVSLFGEESFFQEFGPGTCFFNLWRENIVAQAISLYRAVASGRFHSNDGNDKASPPSYDAPAIQHWLRHLVATENANLSLLYRRRLSFQSLCYETMVKDRLGTLKLFMERLGVAADPHQFAAPAQGELQKIADIWSEEAEQRFRAENVAYLQDMEASRLIRQPNPSA